MTPVLERLCDLLLETLPGAEFDWSNQQVVYVRGPNGNGNPTDAAPIAIHTKRRGGVDLTLVTEPGRIAATILMTPATPPAAGHSAENGTRVGGVPVTRTVRIEGRSHSIVGVMPASFLFPDRSVDLWWPYPVAGTSTSNKAENRELQWYTGIGRLKPGVTPEQARADLAIVQRRLGEEYPDTDADIGVRIVSYKETVVDGIRGSLWLLFGAVSVLLLIACTNIAALLLSRATRREHEIAVRLSLGASRAVVAGQLVAETAVLAFAGAAAGLLVAAGGAADERDDVLPTDALVLGMRVPRAVRRLVGEVERQAVVHAHGREVAVVGLDVQAEDLGEEGCRGTLVPRRHDGVVQANRHAHLRAGRPSRAWPSRLGPHGEGDGRLRL